MHETSRLISPQSAHPPRNMVTGVFNSVLNFAQVEKVRFIRRESVSRDRRATQIKDELPKRTRGRWGPELLSTPVQLTGSRGSGGCGETLTGGVGDASNSKGIRRPAQVGAVGFDEFYTRMRKRERGSRQELSREMTTAKLVGGNLTGDDGGDGAKRL